VRRTKKGPVDFGLRKPVSKAFLEGLYKEFHLTLVTGRLRKVAIPNFSFLEHVLDIYKCPNRDFFRRTCLEVVFLRVMDVERKIIKKCFSGLLRQINPNNF
jgi:hypothetical protein